MQRRVKIGKDRLIPGNEQICFIVVALSRVNFCGFNLRCCYMTQFFSSATCNATALQDKLQTKLCV